MLESYSLPHYFASEKNTIVTEKLSAYVYTLKAPAQIYVNQVLDKSCSNVLLPMITYSIILDYISEWIINSHLHFYLKCSMHLRAEVSLKLDHEMCI